MNIFFQIIRSFINIITNFLFKEIEIIGEKNLPSDGPLIIAANHNSQFIDAALLFHLKRKINFIIAASSVKIPVLSLFLKVVGFIPTNRPDDKLIRGKGRLVKILNQHLYGNGCEFLSLKQNDQIQVDGTDVFYRVKEIKSDNEVVLFNEIEDKNFDDQKYIIFPKQDQSQVYTSVFNKLLDNEVIGIFPEGGSHDRTEMLPLRPGVCIFAWELKKKFGKDVPIVPIGLSYFGAHKFRTKVTLKIGKPIFYQYDESKFEDPEYKRETIGKNLKELEQGLNDCIIRAPSYKEKVLLYSASEIYLPDDHSLSNHQKFAVFKRFSKAYERFKDKDEIKELMQSIDSYRRKVKRTSLKISDIRKYKRTFQQDFSWFLKQFCFMLFLAFPFLMFYYPIKIILKTILKKKIAFELQDSTVKVRAMDIVMSTNVIYGLMLIPSFLVLYGTIFYFYLRNHLDLGFLLSTRLTLDFYYFFPIYLYYAVYLYDHQRDIRRILFFRLKLYLLEGKDYKQAIQELITERYQLKNRIHELMKDDEYIKETKDLLAKRLVKEDHEKYQDKVEQIVDQISKKFVNLFQ